MNEHVCRSFKAVAEYKSISQAARHLNLSPSAVSQHIQHIEAEYQTLLFVRTSQGMALNDTGELVYRYVTDFMALLTASHEAVEDRLHQSNDELKVGASLTIAEYLLPSALTRMDPDHTHTGLTVYMANSGDIVERVVSRDLKVGLIEAPVEHPDLVSQVFLHERLRVVVSATHAWAERKTISLPELIEAPIIIREPGSGTRMALEEALHRAGVRLHDLNIRFVLGTTQAIKSMVARGPWFTVLSPYTVLPLSLIHI